MTPKHYQIIQRAVEEGVRFGWNRAHKHDDKPTAEHICARITDEVMTQITEWYSFADGEL